LGYSSWNLVRLTVEVVVVHCIVAYHWLLINVLLLTWVFLLLLRQAHLLIKICEPRRQGVADWNSVETLRLQDLRLWLA